MEVGYIVSYVLFRKFFEVLVNEWFCLWVLIVYRSLEGLSCLGCGIICGF